MNTSIPFQMPILPPKVVHANTNFKKLVGFRIRQRRLLAHLSQDDLADRCGIYRTYLSRIETGLANPSLVTLVALATTLGVQVSEFFRLEELGLAR